MCVYEISNKKLIPVSQAFPENKPGMDFKYFYRDGKGGAVGRRQDNESF